MNINDYLSSNTFYCSGCGCFFDVETDELVDMPYVEMPATFALQVMQDRQRGFAICHLKQRSKVKSRNATDKKVKTITYKGFEITFWQGYLYQGKRRTNRRCWVWKVNDEMPVTTNNLNDLDKGIAQAKDFINQQILNGDWADIF